MFPDAASVYPTGINNAGAVVGFYTTAVIQNLGFPIPTGEMKSFLREPSGSIIALQYPGAVTTWALTINNSGEIAGTYEDNTNHKQGFIREPNGTFVNIDLPAAPAGQTWDPDRFWVYGINDSRQLSGITANPNPSPFGQIWHFVRSTTGDFEYFDPLIDKDFGSFENALSSPVSSGPINNGGAVLEAFELNPGLGIVTNKIRNGDGSSTTVPYPTGYDVVALTGISNSGLITGMTNAFYTGANLSYYNPAAVVGHNQENGLPVVMCDPHENNVQTYAINDYGVISGGFYDNSGWFIATPTGKSSSLVLSNTSWQFAGHPIGEFSGPGTIYVHSNGPADLNISGITLYPVLENTPLYYADYPDFYITSTTCLPSNGELYQPIPSGQFCQIVFDFQPLEAGERRAEIVINDDSPQAPHVIPIRGLGLGPGLILSNYTWNFSPNETTPQQGTVYAYNQGTEATQVAMFLDTHQQNYVSLTSTCGPTLDAGATCSTTFTLLPGLPPGQLNYRITFEGSSDELFVFLTNR